MSLPLIASEYRDLNGTSIQILNGPPSSLEFARIVNIARPVLIKGCFSPSTLPALSKWSDEYLMSSMHNRVISVAVTPDGLADALKLGPQGSICFTEPYTQKMPFKTFFESLCPEAKDPPNEVYYLQSQNGNLSSDDISGCEFPALKEDVPGDISWATQALGNNPEAVNLWIGDSRSITSAHSDPYENIYTLVRGQKHFTLLPPTEGWTLQGLLFGNPP
ncbi:hypothetical protein FRC02_006859 [Tulasnella sp. 418]|nr:hypothetical protein FRC02_006859 [Tulasnella sp. 418]